MHLTALRFSTLRRMHRAKLEGEATAETVSRMLQSLPRYALGRINILCGENGAGKSTVIDLVSIAAEVTKLGALARENQECDTIASFLLEFEHACLTALVSTIPRADMEDWGSYQNIQMELRDRNGCRTANADVRRFDASTSAYKNFSGLLASLPVFITRFTPRSPSEIDVGILASELSKAASDLPGLLSTKSNICTLRGSLSAETFSKRMNTPVTVSDTAGVLQIYLDDDPIQSNLVQVKHLPSGWVRYAEILEWLCKAPRGAICLLEEPETHLHPTLQRRLARRISAISCESRLQIFIATHSTVLLDSNLWAGAAKIFQSEEHLLVEKVLDHGLLDRLGVRAGDLMQANGVIWVEGPSDRIYIKHWMRAYCETNHITCPVEGVEFSFSLYGGSLAAFSVSPVETCISLLQINRNAAIVIDQDLDFAAQEQALDKPANHKQRIIREIERGSRQNNLVWITDGYTIESYLPQTFSEKYFKTSANGRFILKNEKQSKVYVAERFVRIAADNPALSEMPLALQERIRLLISHIYNWNDCNAMQDQSATCPQDANIL